MNKPLRRRKATPNRITTSGKKASKNFQELDGPYHAMSSEKAPRIKRNVSEEAKTLFSFNATPSAVYDLPIRGNLLD
jgi:hypothetical protein